MTKEQVNYAERKAMELFDKWNEVTGIVAQCSGYYSELRGVIEDSVHIGIQMAINGTISIDEEGDVLRNDSSNG